MTTSQITKNTSISFSSHFAEFIEVQINSGRFASASEVVRAGLRLLEENEMHLRELRAAILEGEQSGEPVEFDFDLFLASKNMPVKDGN